MDEECRALRAISLRPRVAGVTKITDALVRLQETGDVTGQRLIEGKEDRVGTWYHIKLKLNFIFIFN